MLKLLFRKLRFSSFFLRLAGCNLSQFNAYHVLLHKIDLWTFYLLIFCEWDETGTLVKFIRFESLEFVKGQRLLSKKMGLKKTCLSLEHLNMKWFYVLAIFVLNFSEF